MRSFSWISFASMLMVSNGLLGQSDTEFFMSFKEVQRGGVINFEKIVQNQNRMTRDQALKYVYAGDTSKLTCISQNVNMITEKKGDLIKSVLLPSKCMLLDMGGYFVVGYTSFDCNNPDKPQVIFLNLEVLNKSYKTIDRVIVYRETFEFPDILGQMNSKNGLIFLTGFLKTKKLDPSDTSRKIYARILSVNKKTLKFEIIKETADVKGNYTSMTRTLRSLGWEEIFIAENK